MSSLEGIDGGIDTAGNIYLNCNITKNAYHQMRLLFSIFLYIEQVSLRKLKAQASFSDQLIVRL